MALKGISKQADYRGKDKADKEIYTTARSAFYTMKCLKPLLQGKHIYMPWSDNHSEFYRVLTKGGYYCILSKSSETRAHDCFEGAQEPYDIILDNPPFKKDMFLWLIRQKKPFIVYWSWISIYNLLTLCNLNCLILPRHMSVFKHGKAVQCNFITNISNIDRNIMLRDYRSSEIPEQLSLFNF